MNPTPNLFEQLMLIVVMMGWLVFTLAFLLRKKSGNTVAQKRDKTSIIGIVIQMVGYALVWSIRRPLLTPLGGSNVALNLILLILTLAIVVSSVWMVTKAIRALGKQWSLAARVVKGHELIVEGPYRIVRHPIYTGMMGMLLATGFALSYWWVILLALVIFICGTLIRIRIEERLLKGEFGKSYADYIQRVPALIPMLKGV